MWLENYYHLLAHNVFGGETGVNVTNLSGVGFALSGENYINIHAPGYNANENTSGTPSTRRARIVFGTGDAAVHYTDYQLDEKWTDNISRVAVTRVGPSLDQETGVYSCALTATVQNTGSAPVTIQEWGIECGSGGAQYAYLVYRDLLENPVTLNQYEAATFSVTMLYQMPSGG